MTIQLGKMPFTPFHFGISATVGIPLYRKIDVFVFVLASVVIDIEPLIVMKGDSDYHLHGYAHTYIGAALLGAVWGVTAWVFRSPIRTIVQDVFRFPFEASKTKLIVSGILGACFQAPQGMTAPLNSTLCVRLGLANK